MPETSVLDHAQAESYKLYNIKSLIRCQHAQQIKFQLWHSRQAGVAVLNYCIVLSLGFKNKPKQSTYAITSSKAITLAKSSRGLLKLCTNWPQPQWQMARTQASKVYMPSCFGFWLSSEYWPPISCKISVHKQEGSLVSASVIRPELQEVTTQYPASISLSS